MKTCTSLSSASNCSNRNRFEKIQIYHHEKKKRIQTTCNEDATLNINGQTVCPADMRDIWDSPTTAREHDAFCLLH